SATSISNHASSLLCSSKHIYRREAPNFANVPIITMATLLKRQGDVSRPLLHLSFSFLFVFRDEVLKATSLPLLHFVVACSKRHCAREAAHFLLLLFLCPHTTEQGPGNTNPGGSQGSLLEEPFTAARFTNRNIMILQNDRVITIYIQNYKTSKYAGSDTASIQVSSELCRFFWRYVPEFR
ncbi:unnamed protein product, partial [Porites lobata]